MPKQRLNQEEACLKERGFTSFKDFSSEQANPRDWEKNDIDQQLVRELNRFFLSFGLSHKRLVEICLECGDTISLEDDDLPVN